MILGDLWIGFVIVDVELRGAEVMSIPFGGWCVSYEALELRGSRFMLLI